MPFCNPLDIYTNFIFKNQLNIFYICLNIFYIRLPCISARSRSSFSLSVIFPPFSHFQNELLITVYHSPGIKSIPLLKKTAKVLFYHLPQSKIHYFAQKNAQAIRPGIFSYSSIIYYGLITTAYVPKAVALIVIVALFVSISSKRAGVPSGFRHRME